MSSSAEQSFLRYEIVGKPAFSAVRIFLDTPGQQVVAEGGAMIYMDGQIQISTKSTGGIMTGLKRKLSGESMFLNYFELPPGAPPGIVTFAHGAPGDIVHLHLAQGEQWFLSHNGYLCGTPSVAVSSKMAGLKGMFGGEELFFVQVTAQAEGDIWFGGYGMVERHEIPPGAEFVVDHGIMMGFTAGMQYTLGKVGGKKSFVFGGEGIVLRFKGPGIVYTQNRELSVLAGLVEPFLPLGRSA